MSIFDTLNTMSTEYKDVAPAASGKVPDGKYHAICKEARLLEATETKPATLSTSWIIMEGDYKSRLLFISQRIVMDETAYAWLMRLLADLHIQVNSVRELPDALDDFPGRMIVASVVTSKADSRYANVYIDEYIGRGDVEPYLKKGGQAAGAAGDGFQPVDDVDDLPFT